MTSPSELIFFVNGKKVVEKNADPEEVLLAFLRRKVGLTGTKYGCGGGGCGACTVMVSRYDRNQKRVVHFTVNACLQPIVNLHGAAVVTVEGVGSTKTKLHPIQERIAKAHGSQCGFCTPGMVMSMYTLLRNKPQPTMEDIREALGGNLCRCTGYRPIIDGFKTFCGSEQTSGCCQNGGGGGGKCCMENRANGKDSDISQELFPMDDFLPLDPSQDLIFPPELMIMEKKLSGDALYFQGQRVNLVAPAELSHLLELKAQHPSAPLIVGNTTIGPKMLLKGVHHPLLVYGGRISELSAVTWGKNGLTVGAACSLSTLKEEMEKAVVEMEEERTRGYRAMLQTLQCLAGKQIRNMATIGGNLLSANPKYDLCSVLAALDCTLHIISKDGMRSIPLNEKLFPGFGETSLRPDEVLLSIDIPYSKPWEFMAAYRQAQRREFAFSFVNAGMKVVIREGTDIVESLNIYYGGVGSTLVKPRQTCQQLVGWSWGEDLLSEACCLLKEDVDVPSSIHGGRAEYRKSLAISFFFKFYMQVVLPSYTAFRGFGGPQGLMVMESVLHEVAVRCGLPPEKVRSHQGVGQGFCCLVLQIASRVLGVPMSSIFIKETCTGNVPNAAPSAASFGTDAAGMAVKDACEKLMTRLQPLMEKNPKDTWKQWINDAFFQKISLSATGFFMGPPTDVDWEKGEGQAYYYFTFGACCSEVEIDCLTGDHKNIRTDIVMDVGKSINPALDIGQVEGGFVQGVGLYTIEELQFSPDGVLMTRGPSQYKVPVLSDVPAELNVHLLANAENPHAIYLSKGIGEPPVFFGSTIFFAIKAAITAARKERGLGNTFPLSSPATAEKIRMACQDQFIAPPNLLLSNTCSTALPVTLAGLISGGWDCDSMVHPRVIVLGPQEDKSVLVHK